MGAQRLRAQIKDAVGAVQQVRVRVPLRGLGVKAVCALQEGEAAEDARVAARRTVQGMKALVFGLALRLSKAAGIVVAQHPLRRSHDHWLGLLLPDAPVPASPRAFVMRPAIVAEPCALEHGGVRRLADKRRTPPSGRPLTGTAQDLVDLVVGKRRVEVVELVCPGSKLGASDTLCDLQPESPDQLVIAAFALTEPRGAAFASACRGLEPLTERLEL